MTCQHANFVEYAAGPNDGDSYVTIGRCIDCDRFYSLEISTISGEIVHERELDSGEIGALRKEALAS